MTGTTPRTPDQIDKLPDGTLILDEGGEFWLRGSGQWFGHTRDTARSAHQIERSYGIAEVLFVPGVPAAPPVEDEAMQRLARAAYAVDSTHHFRDIDGRPTCLCGFVGDARARTQTEHITAAVIEEYDHD